MIPALPRPDYEMVTLADCVTGYSRELYGASQKNLGNIGKVIASDEFLRRRGT